MAFCVNCGQKLTDGANFCANCGAAVNGNKNNEQRKTTYEGKICKCPGCGGVLNSFIGNCPFCGYELRNVSNSEAVSRFALELSSEKTRQAKISIIKNFIIPNTREDIIEFMILSSTNINNESDKEIVDAWQLKIEQAYQKALIIIKDNDDLYRIKDIYLQANETRSKKESREKLIKIRGKVIETLPSLPNILISVGWLGSLFVLLPLCQVNLDNVGTNGAQLLLIMDFIIGAFIIPLTFNCDSVLPKLITAIGLVLTIVILIPLCGQNLDNVGTNAFQIILIVDIICSAIIFIRMLKRK